jgi:bifunctional non-homologous end joining protein LigD
MPTVASSPTHSPVGSRLGFIPPQIPTLVSEPPAGDGWVHEIKHDGYRTVIALHEGAARAFTRNGHDWSKSYAPVCRAAEALACRSAVIDGEMIVQDENGASDFGLLKGGIVREPERLVLIAFDLLHLDGRDLRSAPLVERRAALRALVGDGENCIGFSEAFEQHPGSRRNAPPRASSSSSAMSVSPAGRSLRCLRGRRAGGSIMPGARS